MAARTSVNRERSQRMQVTRSGAEMRDNSAAVSSSNRSERPSTTSSTSGFAAKALATPFPMPFVPPVIKTFIDGSSR